MLRSGSIPRSILLLLLVATTGFFSACQKDDPDPSTPPLAPPEKAKKGEANFDPNGGILAYYDFSGTSTDKGGQNNNAKVIGEPGYVEGPKGTALYLNETDGLNSCEQIGGQYIQLPSFGELWEKGFTISGWVEFKENRSFERIFDMGNGLGETNGMNVTYSRLEDTDDLVLTSWINSDPEYNRINGRLVAEGVIVNGTMQHYAASISPEGVMKIFVNGKKVAERTDGNPVLNVYREKNYIGHSSYCYLDPDLKGIIDEIRIYNTVLSEEEIQNLHDL